MVGYLPQEGEAQGDETVLDVATGRVEELPQLEKRLHELEAAGRGVQRRNTWRRMPSTTR